MKKSVVSALIVVFLLIFGYYQVFVGGDIKNTEKSNKAESSNSQTDKTQDTTNENIVTIKSLEFGPGTITVKKGGTVTWKNEDSIAHTVTSDTGTELDSRSIAKGETYSKTFDAVGTFDYHCNFHSNMTGAVVVIE